MRVPAPDRIRRTMRTQARPPRRRARPEGFRRALPAARTRRPQPGASPAQAAMIEFFGRRQGGPDAMGERGLGRLFPRWRQAPPDRADAPSWRLAVEGSGYPDWPARSATARSAISPRCAVAALAGGRGR